MNRRNLLRSTALIPIVMTFAGCAGTTSSQVAQIATVGLNAAQDVLAAIAAAGTNIPASIQTYLAEIKTAASAIVANAPAAGASWQQQLYDGIKAVLPIAAPILSAVPFAGLGLAALQAILPVVAGWLGLTGASVAPLVPGIPPMTAAQALKQYGP